MCALLVSMNIALRVAVICIWTCLKRRVLVCQTSLPTPQPLSRGHFGRELMLERDGKLSPHLSLPFSPSLTLSHAAHVCGAEFFRSVGTAAAANLGAALELVHPLQLLQRQKQPHRPLLPGQVRKATSRNRHELKAESWKLKAEIIVNHGMVRVEIKPLRMHTGWERGMEEGMK